MPKITILPHAEICPEGAVVEAEPSKSVCENLLDNNIFVAVSYTHLTLPTNA